MELSRGILPETGFYSAWKLLVFPFGRKSGFPSLHSTVDELLLPFGVCHSVLFRRR